MCLIEQNKSPRRVQQLAVHKRKKRSFDRLLDEKNVDGGLLILLFFAKGVGLTTYYGLIFIPAGRFWTVFFIWFVLLLCWACLMPLLHNSKMHTILILIETDKSCKRVQQVRSTYKKEKGF